MFQNIRHVAVVALTFGFQTLAFAGAGGPPSPLFTLNSITCSPDASTQGEVIERDGLYVLKPGQFILEGMTVRSEIRDIREFIPGGLSEVLESPTLSLHWRPVLESGGYAVYQGGHGGYPNGLKSGFKEIPYKGVFSPEVKFVGLKELNQNIRPQFSENSDWNESSLNFQVTESASDYVIIRVNGEVKIKDDFYDDFIGAVISVDSSLRCVELRDFVFDTLEQKVNRRAKADYVMEQLSKDFSWAPQDIKINDVSSVSSFRISRKMRLGLALSDAEFLALYRIDQKGDLLKHNRQFANYEGVGIYDDLLAIRDKSEDRKRISLITGITHDRIAMTLEELVEREKNDVVELYVGDLEIPTFCYGLFSDKQARCKIPQKVVGNVKIAGKLTGLNGPALSKEMKKLKSVSGDVVFEMNHFLYSFGLNNKQGVVEWAAAHLSGLEEVYGSVVIVGGDKRSHLGNFDIEAAFPNIQNHLYIELEDVLGAKLDYKCHYLDGRASGSQPYYCVY